MRLKNVYVTNLDLMALNLNQDNSISLNSISMLPLSCLDLENNEENAKKEGQDKKREVNLCSNMFSPCKPPSNHSSQLPHPQTFPLLKPPTSSSQRQVSSFLIFSILDSSLLQCSFRPPLHKTSPMLPLAQLSSRSGSQKDMLVKAD
jgi:hypothetical protein